MRKDGGFKEEGNWYKGNLHSHTVDSDGCLTPREAVELFVEHGYSFLGISDHDVYSDYREQLNREDFIIIPAVEASAVLWKDDTLTQRLKVHHVHGILGPESVQKQAVLPVSYIHLDVYKRQTSRRAAIPPVRIPPGSGGRIPVNTRWPWRCLLYTSRAEDEVNWQDRVTNRQP